MAGPLPKLDLSPDPNDNFVLAMAQAGRADLLVTGDKRDLLALARAMCLLVLAASPTAYQAQAQLCANLHQ